MGATEIIQLITTVGFPIVACGAMGWFVNDTTNKHRDEVSKLHEQHGEEMKSVTEAINNNTLALQKLCDKIAG